MEKSQQVTGHSKTTAFIPLAISRSKHHSKASTLQHNIRIISVYSPNQNKPRGTTSFATFWLIYIYPTHFFTAKITWGIILSSKPFNWHVGHTLPPVIDLNRLSHSGTLHFSTPAIDFTNFTWASPARFPTVGPKKLPVTGTCATKQLTAPATISLPLFTTSPEHSEGTWLAWLAW